MMASAILLAVGGTVGAAGIRNRRGPVLAGDCEDGQVLGNRVRLRLVVRRVVLLALMSFVARLLIAAFVRWELRAAEPILPMRLFRSRTFSAASAVAFAASGSVFAAAFLVAQYFQIALGHSPLDAGLRVLPWTATPLVVSPLAGALSDRIGRRPLLVVGLAVQAVGFAWFAGLAGTAVSYWTAILPLLLAGVGISMVLPVTPTTILSAVARADMGKASAVNGTLQRFGSAFGVALATTVFGANGSLASAAAFTDGFRPALAAVAALSLLGALAAVAIEGPRPATVEPAAAVGQAVEIAA